MKNKLITIGLILSAFFLASCSSLPLQPVSPAEQQEFEKLKWNEGQHF